MNSFNADKERGLVIEQRVLALVQRKYPSASLVNSFKGYDIWIPETHKSIEVKYDPMSNDTGNVVIEIEMNGKASGLITTTADYWVFYDDYVFVTLKPISIVNCIFQNKLQYVEFVGKGDKASKKAFLIPKKMLFNCGKLLEA
jgi:hypothetical protein